ncbi:MAG TPA: hypothetical protein VNN07_04245 [Candidatus Tectomicrobia bacterium]|nr:hypothetical protein [Candidatus Tectomicrobia bacterium]
MTAVAVAAITLLNLAHGAWLALRAAVEVHDRQRRLGARLWAPVFASPADVVAWLRAWGAVLGARDARLHALWREGREVVARHAYLAAMAHAWAIAVLVISLRFA